MVKSVLALLLVAVSAAAQLTPQNWKPIAVDKWGGLNLLNDSTQIGYDAQQAQNVLTDSGYLEKRPGNVRLATILSGYPVQYVNDWSAPNGNRYLIAQASNTVYETNFSGAPVALSTIAAGYNLTTVPQFSRLYFADGFRPLWYWDDTSTGTVVDVQSGVTAPICTYAAAKDSRIWCANVPNESSSEVRISSQGGANYWVVPSNVTQVDNAANVFTFNPDDGDSISCLAATPWGMFVGKRYSSYIVKGNGNLSYDPRILDPKIGCVDNRSVQMVYGVLHWLAADGVYAYNGSGPPVLLSRELDPLIKLIRESTYSEGQWSTQLQSDWAAGTTTSGTNSLPPASWNFSSVPGEIFPSSFTLLDDNTDPALQTNGKIGFSSDTLVNIDTATFPFDIGVAQVLPSSSGVQVWISSFPSGNYTTLATTWTVSSGQVATGEDGNGLLGGLLVFVGGGGSCSGHTPQTNTIYTAAPAVNAPPTSNGWNYGYASFAWRPYIRTFSGSYLGGQCWTSNGVNCVEYDAFGDAVPSAAWDGYGLNITQTSCTGTACLYSLAIIKSVSGVRTSLGSGNFALPVASVVSLNSVAYSTFSLTRTAGGAFTAWVGTAPVATAEDVAAAAATTKLSALTLYSYDDMTGCPGPFPAWNNQAINEANFVNLRGYGPGLVLSRIYDTGMSVPVAGALSSSYTLQGKAGETELDFYVRNSTSPNNDLWSTWQASSNSVVASLNERYWQYEALFTSRIASATAQLQTVSLPAITTGYYYSKVNFIGTNITAWKQFAVAEDNPGTYGYAVRSATYAFAADATVPSWTAQTANQNVAVATGTYVQFRLDSTGISNATLAEPIIAVFLRWSEGANIPTASATLDRRYHLCVTISTSATAPDTCLIYQKNGKWVEWIGPSVGAMGYYNYQMVAADGGTTSNVWQIMQPGVLNDDGVPIDGLWVSADYTDGIVFNNKDLHEMWVDATPVQTSSVTLSYAVNKSTSWVDSEFSLDNGQPVNPSLTISGIAQYGMLNQWVPLALTYASGKYLRIKIEDAQLSDYFRVNSYLLYITDEGHTSP